MAPTEMIQFGTQLPHPQPATPPGSPDLSSPEHVRLNNVQQFTEMVDNTVARKIASVIEHLEQRIKLIEAKLPDSAEVAESVKPAVPEDGQPETKIVRASKLEVKTVNEV
jgi:hypothetical protein